VYSSTPFRNLERRRVFHHPVRVPRREPDIVDRQIHRIVRIDLAIKVPDQDLVLARFPETQRFVRRRFLFLDD
jgi:hypothetical protein